MSFLIKDILNKPCISTTKINHEEKIQYFNNSCNYQNIPVVNNNILKRPLAIRSDCNYIYLNNFYNYNNSVYKKYIFNFKQDDEHSQYFNYLSGDADRNRRYRPNNSCSIFYDYTNLIRKGGQIRFTSRQIEELEKWFTVHKYLNPELRKQLAEKLNLTDRQVKTWFQNRRAKFKKNINRQCTNNI